MSGSDLLRLFRTLASAVSIIHPQKHIIYSSSQKRPSIFGQDLTARALADAELEIYYRGTHPSEINTSYIPGSVPRNLTAGFNTHHHAATVISVTGDTSIARKFARHQLQGKILCILPLLIPPQDIDVTKMAEEHQDVQSNPEHHNESELKIVCIPRGCIVGSVNTTLGFPLGAFEANANYIDASYILNNPNHYDIFLKYVYLPFREACKPGKVLHKLAHGGVSRKELSHEDQDHLDDVLARELAFFLDFYIKFQETTPLTIEECHRVKQDLDQSSRADKAAKENVLLRNQAPLTQEIKSMKNLHNAAKSPEADKYKPKL
jgi:hypothetical protein